MPGRQAEQAQSELAAKHICRIRRQGIVAFIDNVFWAFFPFEKLANGATTQAVKSTPDDVQAKMQMISDLKRWLRQIRLV